VMLRIKGSLLHPYPILPFNLHQQWHCRACGECF
jgi:hypothetical protein